MNSWRERREEKQKDAEIRFKREEKKHAWRRRRWQLTHSHLLSHPLVALTLFIVKKCCNFTTVWVIYSLTAVFFLSISICLIHYTFIFDSDGNWIWELILAFIWSTLTPLKHKRFSKDRSCRSSWWSYQHFKVISWSDRDKSVEYTLGERSWDLITANCRKNNLKVALSALLVTSV